MFVVTKADVAVELRRQFPGITDNAKVRACARIVAGWQLIGVPSVPTVTDVVAAVLLDQMADQQSNTILAIPAEAMTIVKRLIPRHKIRRCAVFAMIPVVIIIWLGH